MSRIKALGYLGLSVSDREAWAGFATDVLGLAVERREDGALDLRCDDYAWRIRIEEKGADDIVFAGWEVADAAALEGLKADLEKAGVAVAEVSPGEAADRRVAALIRFTDPEGLRHEAFFGPLQLTDAPFVSPAGAAFKTGSQGLGHIVISARDRAAQERFYVETLGFRVSDYIRTEIVPGRPLDLVFMRCNSRHHSLALAPVPVKRKLVHFMLEAADIDMVGRAMNRAIDQGRHLSFTLGRHSNDRMLSFYVLSPSGFDVEFGCEGLSVEDESWHVRTHARNSAWGHRFQRPPKPNGPS